MIRLALDLAIPLNAWCWRKDAGLEVVVVAAAALRLVAAQEAVAADRPLRR